MNTLRIEATPERGRGRSGGRREPNMKTKTAPKVAGDRGLTRANNRSGTRSQRGGPSHPAHSPREGTTCEHCGNRFHRKRWLAPASPTESSRRGSVCPACRLVAERESYGRIVIRGGGALRQESAIRELVSRVAERARFTQPQRRLVHIERRRGEIEVLTTSQKLAHRIVNSLKRAFGGDASYHWASGDGELRSTWTCD